MEYQSTPMLQEEASLQTQQKQHWYLVHPVMNKKLKIPSMYVLYIKYEEQLKATSTSITSQFILCMYLP